MEVPSVLKSSPQSPCKNGKAHHWILEEAGPTAFLRAGFNAKCKNCGATSGPERNHAVADKNKTAEWHPYRLHDYSISPLPKDTLEVVKTKTCESCGNEFAARSATQKWCNDDCLKKVKGKNRKCRNCDNTFLAKVIAHDYYSGRLRLRLEECCTEECSKQFYAARYQQEKKRKQRVKQTLEA